MAQGYRWNLFRISKRASGFVLQRKGRAILPTTIFLGLHEDFEAMANSILLSARGLQLLHPNADKSEIFQHGCSQNHDSGGLIRIWFFIPSIPFIPVKKAFLTGMKGMRWRALRAANRLLSAMPGYCGLAEVPPRLKLFGHKCFFIYSARPAQSLVLVAARGRAELS